MSTWFKDSLISIGMASIAVIGVPLISTDVLWGVVAGWALAYITLALTYIADK